MSNPFRLNALEPSLHRSANHGLDKDDRKWLILHKTKLFRILTINYPGFFDNQCKNVDKMKYDIEVLKDLGRTYPSLTAF